MAITFKKKVAEMAGDNLVEVAGTLTVTKTAGSATVVTGLSSIKSISVTPTGLEATAGNSAFGAEERTTGGTLGIVVRGGARTFNYVVKGYV